MRRWLVFLSVRPDRLYFPAQVVGNCTHGGLLEKRWTQAPSLAPPPPPPALEFSSRIRFIISLVIDFSAFLCYLTLLRFQRLGC